MDINQYDELSRFMKGVFLERPALPRYTTTWSVDTVLQFLKNSPDKTLLQLSCKLSMLFLLLSAQRCQTLHLIHLTDIKISDSEVCIAPRHVLKQSKPGHHLDMMRFKAFSDDNKLCIVSVFKEYLTRTKPLRNTEKLLISTVKPHEGSYHLKIIWSLISKFQVGLKSLLRQGLSEPNFYGDLVYKLKKIVGSNNFSAQFIKIISHYKKIGYNINVLQQTACLVVNPITVGNFAHLFNCKPKGRTSDSMMVPT